MRNAFIATHEARDSSKERKGSTVQGISETIKDIKKKKVKLPRIKREGEEQTEEIRRT